MDGASKAEKEEVSFKKKQKKTKVAKNAKQGWSDTAVAGLLLEYGQKDRPQGCKDAQLRLKHAIYPCLRNCGLHFKSTKDEKAHYANGRECPNYVYNRKDLAVVKTLQPTPPLEEVIKRVPVCMDLDRVLRVYSKMGIDLPFTKN